ncbi:peptidoglycan DD-metalloendopeptidase family protein [Streptomyces europaeiscabiei]|uniref:Peptidoglycan DD-metalloendopeptidase family protein n=1 Tax=Streptomyces europaeiscabiei TaxID=146819 RepID=A0AAJ2PX11_9ACTN|nr:peptidoglycan DD-metalloendopeptidase family protein [Streptomyces europaeiscabiei]MDX3135260.1 peptidoglycan DD-metalloendopeptidase family protein [Streptomyces europaeiscabiei]
MVAPAVLAAAAKAAKVAKTAKAAGRLAAGPGGGGKGSGGKKNSSRKIWLILGGGGGLLAGTLIFLVVIMMVSLVGGVGGGATTAACGDYADNAEAGNTGDAAATNPVMPAGKMYMPSETARNEIPPKMILASMRAAARYDGLDWTLIAGQMYQETKYGQDPSAAPGGANSLGYMGILQFGKPAWTDYGDDGNGDGKKDLYNIDDAAYAAANFLHAKKAETQPFKALQIYSGSLASNTIYPRVVLTQAARYRGALTGDKDLIKRWYVHLKETIEKNPGFPTLGKQSDIPEPVGNDAQPDKALSVAATSPRSWSTPPLKGETEDVVSAMAPVAYTVTSGTRTTNVTPVSFPGAKPPPSAGKDWQWPMKRGTYTIGTPYHKSGGMWSLGYHTGLDLVATSGTPIYAPADGKVVAAGPGGSYGNMTKLQHAGGVITLYAHQTSFNVSVGDSVKRGQQIGTVGATGNVTGPHLHWEVLVPGVDNPFVGGQDQGPGMVDPEEWLAGRVTANPDYGTVPGSDSDDPARDAEYADCAKGGSGAAVAPDGAGASGVLPDSDDPVIRAVLGWAQRGIGVPYVFGAARLQGQNPTSFDCSSFTQWAYYMASGGKIDIGGTTYVQEPRLEKYEVSLSEAQPGDLIFFRPEGDNLSGHVGIVWDPKSKKIIHAPRPGKNVSFSTWDVQDKITGVYRVPIPAGTNPVEGDGHAEA